MGATIQPRVLKGFRDFLPEAEMARGALVDSLSAVFRSYGYVPIDTPVLEYADILLGKSGGDTEKQIYRFQDAGGRDVAMRFDLTVPFARFLAEHLGELYLPFKRYHIAKAWRGENTQRGRYREFMQCDFDIVGVDTAAADFEIVSVIVSSMDAVGATDALVHVNHRETFNRFLSRAGVRERSTDVLRIVDKLDKIGRDATLGLLSEATSPAVAADVLAYIEPGSGFDATLDRMLRLAGGPAEDTDRILAIRDMAAACGIGDRMLLAPGIMRGHDYYTGIVFETYLSSQPGFPQVCGGGRYNDLASLYTNKSLPGVGASVGLDRLMAAFEESARGVKSPAGLDVLVALADPAMLPEYQAAATRIRAAGRSCEVYPEPRKLGQQFAYAERKGARYAVVRGPAERERGVWTLRDLTTRSDFDYPSVDAVVATLGTRR